MSDNVMDTTIPCMCFMFLTVNSDTEIVYCRFHLPGYLRKKILSLPPASM